MVNEVLDLEQAVEVFPEIKEFVDYVLETNGQSTLKIEKGELRWNHVRGEYFYSMQLALDRNNPRMWIYCREGMHGTAPFFEPAKGEELIKKLPQVFGELKGIYDKCFVRNENVFN